MEREVGMEYRQFGKLDWQASVLGFGAMRLPVIKGRAADIDEAAAGEMVRYAIDHGVNYIDTALPYHEGQSERFLGRILKDGYRAKVKLATKLPPWLTKSAADFDHYLDLQLKHLQTDHIEFYLLHGLNRQYWPHLRDMGILQWAEGAMADGRIGHLGFSFHDEYSVFKEIVDAYDCWILCQIQYNYMDVDFQAGAAGLQYAAERGMAVVVMEPLRGGRLSKDMPQQATDILARASKTRSPAEWALQWVWDRPGVTVVLSGMSSLAQVVENVACADRCASNRLTPEEHRLIDGVRAIYRGLVPVPCTGCQYCLPCPQTIAIPRIFELYNDAVIYNDLRAPRFFYQSLTGGLKIEQRGDRCNTCGACEAPVSAGDCHSGMA